MQEVKINPEVYSWNDINTGAGTQIFTLNKPGSPLGTPGIPTAATFLRGLVHSLIINNPGSNWEIDLYDGTSSSATSIAKIRLGTTTQPTTLLYDLQLNSGLFIDTVKGGNVGDLTVTYLGE